MWMRHISLRWLAQVGLLLCACAGAALASDTLNEDLRGPRPDDPFPIHSFQFGADIVGLTTLSPRHESLAFGEVTFGYHVLDNLSVNAEVGLAPRFLDHEDHDIRAFDALFSARWDFLRVRRFSLFAEAGLGGMHTDGRFANLGRRDDALLVAGAGLSYRVSYNVHLLANARYTHIESDTFRGFGERRAEAIQYGVGVVIVK